MRKSRLFWRGVHGGGVGCGGLGFVAGFFAGVFFGGDNVVDESFGAVVFGFLCAHKVIAVGVLYEDIHLLTCVEREDLVEAIFEAKDLAGMDLDLCGLTGDTAEGLVDQDAGIGEGVAFAFRASGEQDSAHRSRLTDAEGRYGGFDVLHTIVDGESCGDGATGGIDIQVDIFIGIFGFEKEHLSDDQVGHIVIDRRAEEDDAVFEQAGVDIVRAFPSVRLLNDKWDQRHRVFLLAWLFISFVFVCPKFLCSFSPKDGRFRGKRGSRG